MIFVVALAVFLFSFTPKTLLEKNPDRGVYLVLEKLMSHHHLNILSIKLKK